MLKKTMLCSLILICAAIAEAKPLKFDRLSQDKENKAQLDAQLSENKQKIADQAQKLAIQNQQKLELMRARRAKLR